MKKLIALLFALSATTAAAESGQYHVGIKTGSMDTDFPGFDVDTPRGIVFGYQTSNLGYEIEANFTDFNFDLGIISGSLDHRTFAAYATYRVGDDFYFKAKGGLLWQELRSSFNTVDDTGLSAGIGGGAKLGSLSLEAEYTVIDSDINFFSVGLNIHF